LPIADSLPDMPALDGVDLPFGGTRRDLPGGLGDLPAVGGLAGLPAVGDVGLPLGDARTDPPVGGLGDVPLAGGLSELPVVGGLGLPVGDGRSDPPVPGGLGDLPVAGELTELPVVGDLSLPVGAARTDLPIPGLPDLPIVDNLAVGGMPFGGRRSDLPIDGLPAVDDLGLPIGGFDLPLPGATGRSNPEELAGDLVDGLPELPMGARDLPIDIPGNVNLFEELPAFRSNATDVTTVIPRAEAPTAVLPKLTEAELTRPLPAVPAFGDVPVVQVTSVRNLPIQVPAVDPAVNSGTLTDTRAALANLFTYHPIG
ncbi:MAG TPA: hypothetical protein VFG15_20875, partial [Amycolatopsis sp.]|nr:hypothetical protein [Amycolatopsis sp.]